MPKLNVRTRSFEIASQNHLLLDNMSKSLLLVLIMKTGYLRWLSKRSAVCMDILNKQGTLMKAKVGLPKGGA